MHAGTLSDRGTSVSFAEARKDALNGFKSSSKDSASKASLSRVCIHFKFSTKDSASNSQVSSGKVCNCLKSLTKDSALNSKGFIVEGL